MPRANRYILPGYIYHLTHRCHDRKFLLKFAKDHAKRQPKWTESLAVGSRKFIGEIESRVRNRQQTESVQETGSWTLKEDYGSFFNPEKSPIASLQPFDFT